MNIPKRSVGRRLVAALGAAALGLVGVAGVANAADPSPTPGNIDTSRNGESSITVHKFAQPSQATGLPNDGTEITDTGNLKALQGVDFTLYKLVGIDLGTNAGWATAAGFAGKTPSFNSSDSSVTIGGTSYSLTAIGTDETSATGDVSWDTLDFAVYLVVEGADHGSNNIVSPSTPFLVTVPLANQGTWLYDVHAYPKNGVAETPSKTISANPSAQVLGSTVSWTITSKVPFLNENGTFTQAVISDPLPDGLTYTGGSVSATVGGVTVTPTVSGTVTFTFNDSASLKAFTDNQGKDLVLTFNTTVTKTGTITNADATVKWNDGPEVPTTKPVTIWGPLTIHKTDTSNPAKNLKDAEFTVYELGDNDACTADTHGTKVTAGTTGDDGKLTFDGLWIGNYNQADVPTDPTRGYCLVETKVPTGYTGAYAAKVTITPTGASVGTVEVTNVQSKVPNLPLTGANGQLLALIGGGSLVLLAAGTALVARKRSHQD